MSKPNSLAKTLNSQKKPPARGRKVAEVLNNGAEEELSEFDRRTTIYFKHATYEELRHIAYTQRTSITAIVNAAVEAYLDAKGE
jgi:hypothetical protein